MLGTSPLSSLAISDESPFQNLIGVAATGAVGSFVSEIDTALVGVAGAGAVGSFSPLTGVNISLVGVAGIGAAGSFSPEVDYVLTGVSATGAAGSLTPALSISFTGVSGTAGAVGSLAPEIDHTLSGVFGSGLASDFTSFIPAFGGDIIAVNVGLGSLYTRIGVAAPSQRLILHGADLLFSVAIDLSQFNYFRLDLTRPDGFSYSVQTPNIYMGEVTARTSVGDFLATSYVVYRFVSGTLLRGQWKASLYARDRTDTASFLSAVGTFIV